MKILLAGQAYFREDNGQAAFTVRLARGLAGRGHRLMVLAPSEDGRTGPVQDRGVELWRIRTTALPHNANISFFPQQAVHEAVSRFEPDIVHLQDHYFICRAVWRVVREKSTPTVGSNHFLPENLTANLPVPQVVKQPLNRRLWSHMLSLYNGLAAVSTPTETAAAILSSQKIRPRVSVISCGVDLSRFHPLEKKKRQQLRERLGFEDDVTVFLYVGRLDREKGLDTVIKAFAKVAGSDCRLVVAGQGSFHSRLEKLRDSLDLQNQVSFPGFIADEDLPRLLNGADCFIMAGYAELQSIATLEAMACGLPVLAADARALPELVGHDTNGLLFRPEDVQSLADAMRTFLDSADRWRLWGGVSRVKAKSHGLDKTVSRYLAWYNHTIRETAYSNNCPQLCRLSKNRQFEIKSRFGLHSDKPPTTCLREERQCEGKTQ